MEAELEQCNRRIAELEELLAERDATIEELEAAGAGSNGDDEVLQLQALVEAQENALEDQRELIGSQSTLVDDLNRQLQALISGQQREAELEELVAQQRERIRQLEAAAEEVATTAEGTPGAPGDEVVELRALVEAQESALHEQREVISNQSALIDDLNQQLQAQMLRSDLQSPIQSPTRLALDEIPEHTPAVLDLRRGSGRESGDRPIAVAGGAAAGPPAGGSLGKERGPAGPRRRPNDAPPPPPSTHDTYGRSTVANRSGATAAHRGSSGGHSGGVSARRLHRDQHHQPVSQKDLPRPRPNSVLGGRASSGGNAPSVAPSAAMCGTPRARSTTDRSSIRANSPGCGRGVSPHAMRQHAGAIPRKHSGPAYSALPLLRQEA
mmetsp:Transcript_115327/g.229860  ORF Transcript_115327/g.229860 Transcript_115327/m.229860 type:complete len:382 (-) Transcript_115327:155-1300(-)